MYYNGCFYAGNAAVRCCLCPLLHRCGRTGGKECAPVGGKDWKRMSVGGCSIDRTFRYLGKEGRVPAFRPRGRSEHDAGGLQEGYGCRIGYGVGAYPEMVLLQPAPFFLRSCLGVWGLAGRGSKREVARCGRAECGVVGFGCVLSVEAWPGAVRLGLVGACRNRKWRRKRGWKNEKGGMNPACLHCMLCLLLCLFLFRWGGEVVSVCGRVGCSASFAARIPAPGGPHGLLKTNRNGFRAVFVFPSGCRLLLRIPVPAAGFGELLETRRNQLRRSGSRGG